MVNISARVFEADNADYAAQFLLDAFHQYGIVPGQLVVHSDNGASMKAAKTQSVLTNHGVKFSHSRPRVSNDNPYSESFFRTLKYNGDYLYPRDGFESLEHAQKWLDDFIEHYNEKHRHGGIRMVTPGSPGVRTLRFFAVAGRRCCVLANRHRSVGSSLTRCSTVSPSTRCG